MSNPILNIKMTKPGVELVLGALVKLPYEQTAGLIKEIESQANEQLQELQASAALAETVDTTEEETAQ